MLTLEYVEDKFTEAIRNGDTHDIDYWRGYRDAFVAVTREREFRKLVNEIKNKVMEERKCL